MCICFSGFESNNVSAGDEDVGGVFHIHECFKWDVGYTKTRAVYQDFWSRCMGVWKLCPLKLRKCCTTVRLECFASHQPNNEDDIKQVLEVPLISYSVIFQLMLTTGHSPIGSTNSYREWKYHMEANTFYN